MDAAHFEKMLTSEVLFEGRVVTLTKDTALLENGKTATREVVHHHGGACIVPYFEDGTICMVRQFRYAMQQELWELPAGKLEKGEDPFEAAKRELGEECGLTADHYTPLGEFYPTVGYDTEIIYMWVATGLHTTQMHLDDDEFLTPDRIPLAKAYEMVMSGEIKDGKTIAGVLKLKALVDEVLPQVEAKYAVKVHFEFGTMMEVVRACLRAEEIAEVAEFFSFGTNDLTQATFSFSREDAENKFLPFYNESGILKDNPFEALDTKGVGQLMSWAVANGRKSRAGLKVGICGEQGGHPRSMRFCHYANLTYVSCSSPRVATRLR